MSYCKFAPNHPVHGPYHNLEYGFPTSNERVLFERLVLEINQAGLSWLTILTKRENFRIAFDEFDVDKVAGYGSPERERLLADPGIIRNRLKVNAAILNAQRLIEIRSSHGSFAQWLDGGQITAEFLLSTGYLPGAHEETCPVYRKIARLMPPWLSTARQSVRITK
jgi:DNA-3-methyladenine glycosylase I